ncbi:MAG: Ig-like domain-containing protein [Caldilineaceae bacterium]
MTSFRPLKVALLVNLLLCMTLVMNAVASMTYDTAPPPCATSAASITFAEVAFASAAFEDAAGDDPLTCIDGFTVTYVAATAVAMLPIKNISVAADLVAHIANVALKHCRPVFNAPDDIVLRPDGCTATLRIPISRESLDKLFLDKQIIDLIVNDPTLELPIAMRNDLRNALEQQYGHLSNQLTGDYSNVFFMVLPFLSPASQPGYWGDLGAPDIYHFNSDVEIKLSHGGQRLDENRVQFRAGSYTFFWTADTLLAGADLVWIPDFSNIGPWEKAAEKKTLKETIKGWIKAAVKAAKDTYTDIAKNQAKKTKAKIIKAGKSYLAKKAVTDSVGYVLDSYFLDGAPTGAATTATQHLFVIDANPPQISGNGPITVEALEPGGVSSGNHINALKQKLTVTDDCDQSPTLTYNTPSFWPLSLQEDGSTIPSAITWTASDNGAATDTGGVNSTSVTQQVTVVDTKPPILVAPPPVIMEATASAVMTVALGSPQVFDVADLRSTVTNDAPATFTQGVYHINWQATDHSGNVSAATKDTVQIVNLKEPGTNVLPTAFGQTGANAVNAISYEPVKITVRGQDGDPQPDPLWFSIENQPQHGFFIAPLYPYFIKDYRMTARYSPWIAARDGEEVAWQVAQSAQAMRDYIIALCQEDINRTDLPKDFVSGMDYFAVDEAGYTYIYDEFYDRCSAGGSTIAPQTSPRISVWDQEGDFVGQQTRNDSSYPLRSLKINIARGTIIATQSDGSTTGTSIVDISRIQPENAAQPVVSTQFYGLHNYVNSITVGASQTARTPEFKNARAAALDDDRGILYLIGDHNLTGLAAFQPAPCDGRPEDGPEACLDLVGVQIYSLPIIQSTKWTDFPGIGVDAMRLEQINDIALDSQGAVYISVNNGHGWSRVYKFAAPTVHPDGAITLGELVGWMGRRDSGPNCDYVHGRSIGFSCSDATCFLDDPLQETGDRPGQFDGIGSLAFDRNDVLYVGDGGNKRIQRFSRDGYFAGEARSTGDGSSFVQGDFGGVSNIAVNGHSFYIIDTFREIVHVFDAAVIHGIDEASAWVEYQSENNFVGTDAFTFSATDGFRNAAGETLTSQPATVQINVTRNFRPPEATAGLAISVTEDTPTPLLLEGYDIDGDLDTLTFQVTTQPGDGKLSGAPPNLIYAPNPNFADQDRFSFTVSDGRFTSQPEEFVLDVVPVNDPPVLTLDAANLRAGAGYPFTLAGTILDPEVEDDLTVQVNWGDGVIENEGAPQSDGTLNGPVLDASGDITRTLRAYHTYASPGAYALAVTITDPAGATATVQRTVTVEAMADLALRRRGGTAAAPSRPTLTYELAVVNLPPSSGGVTASGINVQETLGAGFSYRTASTSGGSCQAAGQNLSCTLDSLAPGAEAVIRVVVDAAASTVVGDEVAAQATVSATQPDPLTENNRADARLAMLPDADFLVDTHKEGSDTNPGDGLCQTANGECTVRRRAGSQRPARQTVHCAGAAGPPAQPGRRSGAHGRTGNHCPQRRRRAHR